MSSQSFRFGNRFALPPHPEYWKSSQTPESRSNQYIEKRPEQRPISFGKLQTADDLRSVPRRVDDTTSGLVVVGVVIGVVFVVVVVEDLTVVCCGEVAGCVVSVGRVGAGGRRN